MKKFMFSMEKLLTYKNQHMANQLAILGELNHQLHQTNQQIKALIQEMGNYGREFDCKVKQKAAPALFQIYQNYLNALKEQIRLQEEKKLDISKKIEQQVKVIKQLKQETKSLETLKDAKFREYQAVTAKRSELQLEEFVMASRSIRHEFQF